MSQSRNAAWTELIRKMQDYERRTHSRCQSSNGRLGTSHPRSTCWRPSNTSDILSHHEEATRHRPPRLLLPLRPVTQTPGPHPSPSLVPASTACAAQPSATQNFDYYLLNLSWSPEFCHSHPNATECAEHSTFVLHGLWPQNNDGTYPQNCSTEPGPHNPADYNDIYADPGLLRHEWRTHGTCSGLSPDAVLRAGPERLPLSDDSLRALPTRSSNLDASRPDP